jgi:hypothetical protein
MWLVENERMGNPQQLRLYKLARRDALREPVRSVKPDVRLVVLSYGGAALFGIAFWSFVIWLFL